MANPCYSHKLLLSRFPKKFENKDVFLPVRQSELASLLPKGFLRRKIISGQTLSQSYKLIRANHYDMLDDIGCFSTSDRIEGVCINTPTG